MTLFRKEPEEKYLDKLVAVLYDHSYEESQMAFDKRVQYVKENVKMKYKLAVYFNFILMLAWLANMFPNVFKRASGRSKKTVYWKNILGAWMEFKSEDYHKKDMQGMMEVLDSLEGINGRDGK